MENCSQLRLYSYWHKKLKLSENFKKKLENFEEAFNHVALSFKLQNDFFDEAFIYLNE